MGNFQQATRTCVQRALLGHDGARRGIFGVGEIVGVLTNVSSVHAGRPNRSFSGLILLGGLQPTEVLRNLTESKKMLEEARRELKEAQERAQSRFFLAPLPPPLVSCSLSWFQPAVPASHTFSPLPGFFDRPAEIRVLERSLGSVPGFTVLFGASSVGKTALLRQVLSDDKYHVVHFDLRIAGFADLASLYFSLSTQLESYFAAIPDLLGREWGWGEFEKESFAFKHDRLDVMKRMENGGEVKTSVSHPRLSNALRYRETHAQDRRISPTFSSSFRQGISGVESSQKSRLTSAAPFQSALLSYWNFQPMTAAERREKEAAEKDEKDKHHATDSKPKGRPRSKSPATPAEANDPSRGRHQGGAVPQPEKGDQNLFEARSLRGLEAEDDKGEKSGSGRDSDDAGKENEAEEEEEERPPPKKMPVFFLDEAHKVSKSKGAT